MGFDSMKSAVYIHCCEYCENYAMEVWDWRHESIMGTVPADIDVSKHFGFAACDVMCEEFDFTAESFVNSSSDPVLPNDVPSDPNPTAPLAQPTSPEDHGPSSSASSPDDSSVDSHAGASSPSSSDSSSSSSSPPDSMKRRTGFTFEERLEQLREFKSKFGHVNMKCRHGEYGLGNWLSTQKSLCKRKKLKKERRDALAALGCPGFGK